jgi:hypothetical protein
VARESFSCELDGIPVFVTAGERVRAGHKLLREQAASSSRPTRRSATTSSRQQPPRASAASGEARRAAVFYDEPVPELVACIKGLHDAGVTELVAVDGAYALYPDGQPASDPNQHAAIVLACRRLGMGCTLHVPARVWAGNEVEKRTFLFKLGWTVAEEGDWFWVQDADMVPVEVPDDFTAAARGDRP